MHLFYAIHFDQKSKDGQAIFTYSLINGKGLFLYDDIIRYISNQNQFNYEKKSWLFTKYHKLINKVGDFGETIIYQNELRLFLFPRAISYISDDL